MSERQLQRERERATRESVRERGRERATIESVRERERERDR